MPWYVAFEGPIAAGKTTLAGLFAAVTGARTLLEDFASNEFLIDFYANRERWAFAMQLGFLSARHEQLSTLMANDALVVADHTYAKDIVFARVLLKDRELRLYERFHRTLTPTPRDPHLIVYLDAADEVLLERITARGRPYEASINAAYLEQLRNAYQRELLTRTDLRILKADTGCLALDSPSDLEAFFGQILANIPRTPVPP